MNGSMTGDQDLNSKRPIYLDHHATTPVDPLVFEAMRPYFSNEFGNPGSITHQWGTNAKEAVDRSIQAIAHSIGATDTEMVITSGSTESCNLAIIGFAERLKSTGHIVSSKTEHRAVLDPIKKLEKRGFEVSWLDVYQNGTDNAGQIDINHFEQSLRPGTLLVSVMLANNEIGVIQPIKSISEICRDKGIALHVDATQAIGKIRVNVDELGVDLLSFSSHKFNGPKGIGALYVRSHGKRVRLEPQMVGGGQQRGIRSGTLNVPCIVGMAEAIVLSVNAMEKETPRIASIRNVLFEKLSNGNHEIRLNGPLLADELRLPNNLNIEFVGIDGQTLMSQMPEIALSSGAACSAASPTPSHVLAALGLDPDQVRSSVRFGLGHSNSMQDAHYVSERIEEVINSLKK